MVESYNDATPAKDQQGVPTPPGFDVEGGTGARPDSAFRGVSGIKEGKKDDWMKKGIIVLRALGLLFSFLAFIITVTITGFTTSQSLTYVFVIALFAMIYTAVQTGIKIHLLRTTTNSTVSSTAVVWFDFSADMIMAYLLLSSASAGASIWPTLYVDEYSVFERIKAGIAMSFLAFFCLSPSSLISGYLLVTHLSTQ